jgi:hypothetical protein
VIGVGVGSAATIVSRAVVIALEKNVSYVEGVSMVGKGFGASTWLLMPEDLMV